MNKVAIVTDSTGNIPPEQMAGLNIHIVPLMVLWGEESLRDGVDITPTQFYQRLETTKIIPSTSQPSPAAFEAVFNDLAEKGYDVLCILISSKLSGTVDSARNAKNNCTKGRIEVIDSLNTAMSLGYLVLLAAQTAQQGASLDECKKLIEANVPRAGAYFVVPTLEYLHRGGRIGSAATFLGNTFDLKPVLWMNNGRIDALERVRTFRKALDRVVALVEKTIGKDHKVYLSVVHANAQEDAAALLERQKELFSPSDIKYALTPDLSPVIGTHTGPGTLGATFFSEL